MTGRRGRRRKKLPNDLQGKGGYFKSKDEALGRTVKKKWLLKGLWTCLNLGYEINE